MWVARPGLWPTAVIGLFVLIGIVALAVDRFAVSLPTKPADRALPVRAPTQPLRVTILGTSLTARYDWPEALALALTQCLDKPPEITVIAMSGAASDWGVGQVGRVVASTPDIVLIEFGINDADLRHRISLRVSADLHRQLVSELRAGLPDIAIALMTTNPAYGLRRVIRPRLARYYAQYVVLADKLDLGLVDIYPRWLALPRRTQGLAADGLHPEQEVASAVFLSALPPFLGRATGVDCPAPI